LPVIATMTTVASIVARIDFTSVSDRGMRSGASLPPRRLSAVRLGVNFWPGSWQGR
jgi:hypothetical protein